MIGGPPLACPLPPPHRCHQSSIMFGMNEVGEIHLMLPWGMGGGGSAHHSMVQVDTSWSRGGTMHRKHVIASIKFVIVNM